MSDGIASDAFVVSEAVMLEQQLHMIRLELEEIRNGVSRPSNYALIRHQRHQLREIARLAAETVQALNAREIAA